MLGIMQAEDAHKTAILRDRAAKHFVTHYITPRLLRTQADAYRRDSMADVIMMSNPDTGEKAKGFAGFSWTVCFWGGFPALFRKDWRTGLAWLLIQAVLFGIVDREFYPLVTLGNVVFQIIWAFAYNRNYTRQLISRGFRFHDSDMRNQLGATSVRMSPEDCILTASGTTANESAPVSDAAANTAASTATPSGGHTDAKDIPSTSGQTRGERVPLSKSALEGLRRSLENPQTHHARGGCLSSLMFLIVAVLLVSNWEDIQHYLHETVGYSSKSSKEEKIKALEAFSGESDISPRGELYEMFKLNSPYTDIQRENKLASLKGRIVRWECTVYEVSKRWNGDYTITTSQDDGHVAITLNVVARNDADVKYIESLMTGSRLAFIGMFNGETSLRRLELDPAILARPLGR